MSEDKQILHYTYNTKCIIGNWSYWSIYKGFNQNTKQPVTIKVISKQLFEDDQLSIQSSLVQELKVRKEIKGQNIVETLDIIESKNHVYIVQEHSECSLYQRLKTKQKTMPEKEAIKLLIDILTGYLELLKKQIAHRDLKTATILIDKGVYKIGDFSFAAFKGALGTFSHYAGFPDYLSPQLLENQEYSQKTDIWSIGVIFYEVLFGYVPWSGRNSEKGKMFYEYIKKKNKLSIKALICHKFSLFQELKSQQLTFPLEISDQARNFIQGCLEIDESQRFDWQAVYDHPLFEGHFINFIIENKLNEEQYLLQNDNLGSGIIQKFKQKLIEFNINLQQLFDNYSASEKVIIKKDFYKLFKNFEENIDEQVFDKVFEIFDQNKDQVVSFEEFKKILKT